MSRSLILLASLMIAFSATATAQSAADSAAIKQTALDYIQGWYSGDAERMERALHPDLAKRIVATNPETGKSMLRDMTATQLVEATRAGYGTRTPEAERQDDVTILDIYEGAACVKVVAKDWIDYLQVGKFDGQWVIINVLWELKPEARGRM